MEWPSLVRTFSPHPSLFPDERMTARPNWVRREREGGGTGVRYERSESEHSGKGTARLRYLPTKKPSA